MQRLESTTSENLIHALLSRKCHKAKAPWPLVVVIIPEDRVKLMGSWYNIKMVPKELRLCLRIL